MEGATASYVSTPDSVGLSITGDTEIQLDLQLSSYVFAALANKSSGTPQVSWLLELLSNGNLRFFWSPDGTALKSVDSTLPLPIGRVAVKVTLAVATGTVTFYTAPTISGSWTQLGSSSSGTGGAATSVFDSTSPVVVGDNTSSPYGSVYGFKLLSGIGGTTKAYADFTAQTAGAASFTDAQSNTWTLNGSAEISNRVYRFHGEVPAWPPRWDYSGKDVYTPIQASGVTRRLTQGSPASDSVMKRFNRKLATPLLAYWPCEDGSTSTQLAATVGSPLGITGSPNLASNTTFLCSSAIPALNQSIWQANLPQSSTTPTTNNLKFLLNIPQAGDPMGGFGNGPVAWMFTTGTVAKLELNYSNISSSSLELIGYSNSGAVLFSGVIESGFNGGSYIISMVLSQSGGNVAYSFKWVNQASPTLLGNTGSTVAGSIGQVSRIVLNPAGVLTTTALGHVMVNSADDITSYESPLNAYRGETAAGRFERICLEEGLACRVYGYQDSTQAMGAQTPKTVMQLLQECEDTDRGMLYEPRQVLGIGYRTRLSMENQAAAVTLAYGDLGTDGSTTIDPTDDDQFTRNDVTITRANGSSSRQVLASGSLSTASPQLGGVGTYDYSQTYSIFLDSQTDDLAGWILHVGTTDEPRYPSIPVNLTRLAGQTAKYYGLQGMDVGDFLDITGLPSWLPPGDVKQIVAGTKESIGGIVYTVQYNCIPERPYETGVAGSGATSDNRVDTDGSTLGAALTATSGYASVPCSSGYPALISAATYNLTGSNLAALVIPSQGADRETYLQLSKDANNHVDMYYSGGTLSGRLVQAGVTTSAGSVTYDPSKHIWWKIAESAGTISWYYSPDGATWTLLWTHAYTLTITAVNVVVTSGYFSTDVTTTSYVASMTGLVTETFASNDLATVWAPSGVSVTITTGVAIVPVAVTTSANYAQFLWTTTAGDFPFDILVGGERMTVTSITGSSSPQTFTVTRSVNGVVKAHSSGEAVNVYSATIAALSDPF
nr:hypothetical protein Hi04_10k_c361_00008 [uncultured bacterium]